MVVDVREWILQIFYLDPSTTSKENMKLIAKPFSILVPKILKQSKMFAHIINVKEEMPLLSNRELGKTPKQQTS